MLLLGIDLGTSSVKVSVVDAATGQPVVTTHFPETEATIISPQHGWAEQDPNEWWHNVQQAIVKAHAFKKYNPADISAIGIAYQMHGLVCIDKQQQVLRNSIIWCDSRAITFGEAAFNSIGEEKSLRHLLNSPGNFTASKLAWVKQNEPGIFEKTDKVMLPGDYIAMKLTSEVTTTIVALSEGIFWDFKNGELSKDVMNYFGFSNAIIPAIKNVFDIHGLLSPAVAEQLSLTKNIPITYKAGDQPNNAFSLNVLKPGDVAANAGTSGVIYAVTNQLFADEQSRVNSFAHVNHTANSTSIGVLLCINGTGIMNKWIKNITGGKTSYKEINEAAGKITPGSNKLKILPFGNGAERMLNNKIPGAQISNIDLNIHTAAHLYRAVQEGIAFAFRYGLDILRENNIVPAIIKAGKANMFLSEVFANVFAGVNNVPVELYNSDGSVGAAIGAGVGAGMFTSSEAFDNIKPVETVNPGNANIYEDIYQDWKSILINNISQ